MPGRGTLETGRCEALSAAQAEAPGCEAPGRKRLFQSRFGGMYVLGIFFLVVCFLLRTALWIRCRDHVTASAVEICGIYLLGLFYDVLTALFALAPVSLFLLLAPQRVFASRPARWALLGVYTFLVFGILFGMVCEWLFWGEFDARFNFVAVDYLVYTKEILGNTWESYPVPVVLPALLAVTALIVFRTRKFFRRCFDSRDVFRKRLLPGSVFLAVPLAAWIASNYLPTRINDNRYVNELAKNGVYGLVDAYFSDAPNYYESYVAEDDAAALGRLRKLLRTDEAEFIRDDPFDWTRQIAHPGPEKRHNVVLLMVESLSAKFLDSLGGSDGLTPNLDALAKESVLFTNCYATGTRTTRGLEAVVLSLPPTPGRTLVKRPNTQNLFTVGQLFHDRDYDTKFLYGGDCGFDNMNVFLTGNGFDIIDIRDIPESAVTFTNAWGICDEDLLRRTLQECDASHSADRVFYYLVLTASNHRPYTFPEGKVNLPSGERPGAVRYTDYALGKFFQAAKQKPWFENTIFVLVADHCANSTGDTDVPVQNYHIPLMFYAPHLLPARRIDKPASQMDVAPTLAGLLNWTYRSKFFGRDLFQPGDSHVLLGTHQLLGLFSGRKLVLLAPRKEVHTYRLSPEGRQVRCENDVPQTEDAVSYYQSAAYVTTHGLYTAEPPGQGLTAGVMAICPPSPSASEAQGGQ